MNLPLTLFLYVATIVSTSDAHPTTLRAAKDTHVVAHNKSAAVHEQRMLAHEAHHRRLEASRQDFMNLVDRQLTDDCPTTCEVCEEIKRGPPMGPNRYPCDEDEDRCCGDQCENLGLGLTYLEDYSTFLQSLQERMEQDEAAFMDQMMEWNRTMVNSTQPLDQEEISCLQARIILRNNMNEEARIKANYILAEKAIIRDNLVRVFTECVEQTWCENDDTQEKLGIEDISFWERMLQLACYAVYYGTSLVTKAIGISIEVMMLPFTILKEAVCYAKGTTTIDAFLDYLTGKAGDDSGSWLLYTINSFLCVLGGGYTPGSSASTLSAFCIVNNPDYLLEDRGQAIKDQILEVEQEFLDIAHEALCDDPVSVLLKLLVEPLVCQIDVCQDLPFLVDCDDYFLYDVWYLTQLLDPNYTMPPTTTAPTTDPTATPKDLYVGFGETIVNKGTILNEGFQLYSRSGKFLFEILSGGVAQLTEKGHEDKPLFSSAILFEEGVHAAWDFTADGYLIATDIVTGAELMRAGDGLAGVMMVSEGGALALLKQDIFEPVWTTFTYPQPDSTLSADMTTYPDQFIMYSHSGNYRIVFQIDGNLVIYQESNGKAVWDSGTTGAFKKNGDRMSFDAVEGLARVFKGTKTLWDTEDCFVAADDKRTNRFWFHISDSGSLQIINHIDAGKPMICFDSSYD